MTLVVFHIKNDRLPRCLSIKQSNTFPNLPNPVDRIANSSQPSQPHWALDMYHIRVSKMRELAKCAVLPSQNRKKFGYNILYETAY